MQKNNAASQKELSLRLEKLKKKKKTKDVLTAGKKVPLMYV